MRYTLGFKDPTVKSSLTERNPGFVPIVDNRSFAAFGLVVAICDNFEIAERIVNLLNAAEPVNHT